MELFKSWVTVAYAIDGAILFLLYMPQLWSVYKDHNGAKAINLITWGLWINSSLITLAYAWLVANDSLFALMSFGNFSGCSSVVVMTVVRRVQFRKRMLTTA